MTWRIPLADIDLGPEEFSAVKEVLESRWLTMGEVTQKFEAEFAAYTGSKHAVAVTNCTAALHLACIVADLKPEDDVIVPSLTFVATANAIRYVGATPVFADIAGSTNLCISPETIEPRITRKTRAIIVMHYAGYACDLPGILALAKKHNLVVIEDAAHAAGSSLEGRMLGTWGQTGCYSFFSNKNMTTGEGGMIVTDDDAIAERLRILRSHGMTAMTWDRHQGHAWTYDVVAPGYNYRIDEMRAAIGRIQLAKLDRNNGLRAKFTRYYQELLQELVPSVVIPFIDHPGKSACHILPVLLPTHCDRERFMEEMKAQGIQTSIHYPPIHQFTSFSDDASGKALLPTTEYIGAHEVTLPLYSTMTEDQVGIVAQVVKTACLEGMQSS